MKRMLLQVCRLSTSGSSISASRTFTYIWFVEFVSSFSLQLAGINRKIRFDRFIKKIELSLHCGLL